MHTSKLANTIVRYAKHLNPNLRTFEFSLSISKSELEHDIHLRHLLEIDDERDIAYLRGRIDQRNEN